MGFLAVALVLGVMLRLHAYFQARPFWLDDALIVTNLRELTRIDLLLPPLYWHQHGPAGFLQLERLALDLAGPSPLALHALPTLAGLLALVLFARLASRTLPAWPAALATGLLALNAGLLFYGVQAKPYATDVLATTAILLSGTSPLADDRQALRRGLWWGLLAWLSSPSGFVVLGITLTNWTRRSPRLLAAWALGAVPALLHALSYAERAGLQAFWADGFPASDPLRWLLTLPVEAVRNGLVWDHPLAGLMVGVAALVLGVLVAPRLAGPVAVTVLAAAAQRYPFGNATLLGGRVILFLVPPLILLAVQGVARLPRPIALPIGAILLVASIASVRQDRYAYTRDDMPALLAALDARGVRPEQIYVYYNAHAEYRAYRGQDGATFGPGHLHRGDGPADVATITPPRWLVFSLLHVAPVRAEVQTALAGAAGVVRDSLIGNGVAAYLLAPIDRATQ